MSSATHNRCPSCGGELVERLGDVECPGCGMRVLRREPSAAGAGRRDPGAAPWDPPSNLTRAVSPPQREAGEGTGEAADTVHQLGLRSGGIYRPRVRDLGSPGLDIEKWIFLAAFFLGSAFTTCAFAVARGESLSDGGVFFAVTFLALMNTLPALVVLFWRSASLKNGCLLLIVGMLLLAGYNIYRAVTEDKVAIIAGLTVHCLLLGWLWWILLRDNELE